MLEAIRSRQRLIELGDDALEDYQRTVLQAMIDNPKFALFLDTGLGKTAVCLRFIREMFDRDAIRKVLVIAPLKVANQTWPSEIPRWAFSNPLPFRMVRTPDLVEAVNGAGRAALNRTLTEKERAKVERAALRMVKKERGRNPSLTEEELLPLMKQRAEKEYRAHTANLVKMETANRLLLEREARDPAVIHIVNCEMVEWVVEAWGADWPYQCVIYDESDGIKDHTTKRWKALRNVAPNCDYFYELTATPNAESYLGLWAQMFLLDGGKRLGRTFTEYKERYFDENRYSHKITLRKGSEERIAAKLADITLEMKQQDYLKDVAPYRIQNVLYELPEHAIELYKQMDKNGVAEIGDKTIYADQAVSVLQKLLQISAGFIYDTEDTLDNFGAAVEKRNIYPIHDAKIEKLKELQELHKGEPLLVSYVHQGSLEKLCKHFPEAVVMDRKGTQRKAWNDGKIKMLLMHPKSGAHGLNLQFGGHIVINYDVHYSYGQFYQFLRRLARRGQPAAEVLVYNLLGAGTYDIAVEKACWQEKRSMQEAFFDLIKRFRKHGKNKAKRSRD